MTKQYQLVAWTDKGQVKMLPEVLREYERPFLERIECQLAAYQDGWRVTEQDVIALSRSYEAYGRFLLLHGRRREAFMAFVDGARVCLDDRFVIDSMYGYVLVGVLPKRYHYVKTFCQEMIEEDPELARFPKWQKMLEWFRKLDAPFAEQRRLVRREWNANRAFNFGRRR